MLCFYLRGRAANPKGPPPSQVGFDRVIKSQAKTSGHKHMRKTVSLLLVASMGLAGCGFGGSSLNPVNWFGRSQSVPIGQSTEVVNPLIPKRSGLFARERARDKIYQGKPFQQITSLVVERVPGGAIIRATGLAARQGIYDVQLTPANEDEEPVKGVLTYRLEGLRPARNTAQGTKPTREVVAARKLTDQQLRSVRTIRVEGQLNALVARR